MNETPRGSRAAKTNKVKYFQQADRRLQQQAAPDPIFYWFATKAGAEVDACGFPAEVVCSVGARP
jgi:hypothetical protein